MVPPQKCAPIRRLVGRPALAFRSLNGSFTADLCVDAVGPERGSGLTRHPQKMVTGVEETAISRITVTELTSSNICSTISNELRSSGERDARMTPPIVRTMVLWCPDWPITAALREAAAARTELSSAAASTPRSLGLPWGDTTAIPLALIEHGVVFACSAAARAEGVTRGLRVREAQARCPELVVQPYDAVQNNRSFEPILTAVEAMMPGVQLLRPGTCAIRSRGPARYYGGEKPAALALVRSSISSAFPAPGWVSPMARLPPNRPHA